MKGANNDLVNYMVSSIQNAMAEIEAGMANGNCVNFESYQRLVGVYQGLSQTLSLIDQYYEDEKNASH
jgi:hypothetical protein